MNCSTKLNSIINQNDEILDIYLLETILNLGKYHQRYFSGEANFPPYGLRKYITEIFSERYNNGIKEISVSLNFWKRLLLYAKRLKSHAVETGVWNHYQEIELPFANALNKMTTNGITIDLVACRSIRDKSELARQKLLYALDVNNVGGSKPIDLNNWVKGYGFDEFFPAGRDSISMRDISLLEDKHQVFKIFQRLEKLKRIENFVDKIGSQNTIKPFFKTMGTATSRCTSVNPNIMGIPKVFRPVVIPSRLDYGIVECDYSQMEVGIAAALSNDKNLIEDFNNTDVYEKVGELLFGHLGGGSRSKAKIIFLGIQYGLSQKTLAKRLELSEEKTLRILNRLFSRYNALSKYLSTLEKSGQENGFARSISGLKRYRRYPDRIPSYWEKNWLKNYPIQASAASVFKKAIIKIYQELKREPFRLLVPHYDSVVFECPLDRMEETTEIVVDCMTHSMNAYFPSIRPKVSVNNSNPSCWNSEGVSRSIETFLDDPLFGIDIRERQSSNVNWSEYL